MDGLTEGRIVHFVIPEHQRNAGEHRPAMVVRVWDNGLVNLLVFYDGTNDGIADNPPIRWTGSAPYSEDAKPYSWHWIERA